MSSPTNASTDPKTDLRFYRFNDRDLISVTSIRKTIGMPFPLHNWVLNQAIEAANKLRPVAGGLTDEAYAKAVRQGSTVERDNAASLGTAVHEAADSGIKAALLAPDDPRRPFLAQYEDWMHDMNPTVLVSEAQVFSLDHGYAGSLDMIADVQGKRTLIDLKTGKHAYNDHALQLVLYFMADFIGGYDLTEDADVRYDAHTAFLKSCTDMAILHLRPEGWEYIPVPPTEALADYALSMVKLCRFYIDNPTIETLQGAVVKGAAL